MSLENGHVNLIRRYLLEDLSEDERDQIEQLLMSNDEFYQDLLYAEEGLIDDSVFDRLPEEDQLKFKNRFLDIPKLRQSVNLTAALRKHALETMPALVAAEPAPRRPTFLDSIRTFLSRPAVGLAFSALLLGVIGLNVWLLKRNSELRGRIGELEARQLPTPISDPQEELRAALKRAEELQTQLDRNQQLLAEESRKRQSAEERLKGSPRQQTGAALLAVTLLSGGVRDQGEGTKRVQLQPDTRRVQFTLDLSARDHIRYSVVLVLTDSRQVKWSESKLELTPEKFVSFQVPAKRLAGGDYHIVLSGVKPSGVTEQIDDYYFRVVR